jgi:hypothetical protein
MSPFGPFYPPRLQARVNHAERLYGILLEQEELATAARSTVPAWLIGRAGELEQVVSATVQQWRSGRRGGVEAAAALQEHLDALHDGLAAWLGVTAPTCCQGAAATTETAPLPAEQALVDSIDRLLANLEPQEGGAPPR